MSKLTQHSAPLASAWGSRMAWLAGTAPWWLALALNGLILAPTWLWLRTWGWIGVSLLTGCVWIHWLLAQDKETSRFERLLYGVGAGFALWIWLALFLSYLPGGLAAWQLLLTMNGLLVAGLILAARTAADVAATPWLPAQTRQARTWWWVGLVLLVAIGGLLRLRHLGYAEFQGDEAKVMMHAVAVVNGNEDALFAYRKGPVEILIPASTIALFGAVTEGAARLPFAIANVVCLLVIFFLGWWLVGPLGGWIAALLLAFDGYFIGTTRIVQYTSFIFLMGALTVLPLARLAQGGSPAGRARWGYLILAALFVATGTAAHYEGIAAGVPALFLLWVAWRRADDRRALVWPAVVALACCGALLASFYVPFLRHPHFTATVERYTGDVIGTEAALDNNLLDFAQRGMLYNVAYSFFLAVAAGIVAILVSAWRGHHWLPRLAALLALCAAALLLIFPTGLSWAGVDWTPLLALLLLLTPILLPQSTMGERALWLWLLFPFVAAAFLIQEPSSHFYAFYTPWMLIAGGALALIWQWIARRVRRPLALAVGALAVGCAVFVFGGYAYAFFVYHDEEVVRHWQTQQTIPRAWVWAQPEGHPLFGMPHDSGWRLIGELFADGTLSGPYASNMRHWIPEWYTRQPGYCEFNPDWLFLQQLDRRAELAELLAALGEGYQHWGTIIGNGEPQIEIYGRAGSFVEGAGELSSESVRLRSTPFATDFQAASLELKPPTTPLGARFGDRIELVSYGLVERQGAPGDSLRLVLEWRALGPIDQEFQLFAQIIGPEDRMIGQRDAMPDCNAGPTWEWEPGERLISFHQVPIFAGEAPGVYPLFVGLYDLHTLERLSAFTPTGEPMGDRVELAQITVLDPP
jgi:4-amino-4-deoxy-L-arabinose transferase-like glycosyltransferase